MDRPFPVPACAARRSTLWNREGSVPRETRIWMPMYWADYLADTTHLSTFQHGCYLLMIAAYWRNGGPLPDDPTKLAHICRTTKDKLARYGNPVLGMFTAKNGWLYHQRIENEINRSNARINAARTAGQRSAQRRANKSQSQSQCSVSTPLRYVETAPPARCLQANGEDKTQAPSVERSERLRIGGKMAALREDLERGND